MTNISTTKPPSDKANKKKVKYPGIRITTNGNQLIAYHTEARITDGGVFYPITPSTEGGENYQLSTAQGNLNVFGQSRVAIETEGEHAAQGGAIALSVTGKRVVNFTSGQGIVYGVEQYYHAPGKCSTMVLEVGARALTKHALNVHCGHDDIYGALDTGWIMVFGKDAQQAADQALILRKVTEKSLTPGMNIQDGFLTTHLERTFLKHEAELIREFLGAPDDIIDCPTPAQRELFGPTRRRVPEVIDLRNPTMIGPVQNQEHYMNGVIARRNNFVEPILTFLEEAYEEFGNLTGRHYGLVSQYKCEDADTVIISLGSAAENVEAAIDYLQDKGEKVGGIHINVIRPFPEAAVIEAIRGKKNVIILERTDEPMAGDNPLARDIRTAISKAQQNFRFPPKDGVGNGLPALALEETPKLFAGSYGLGSRDFRPEGILGAYEYSKGKIARKDGKTVEDGINFFVLGIDHPYEVKSSETPSLLPDHTIAIRFHSIGGWGMITTGKNLGEIIGEIGAGIAKKANSFDEYGNLKEVVHISANPKYGSEKKGAPTSYFLSVAPERIRVNCDLRHVDVVLCCDSKAFTHTNPLDGLNEGGAFVWESEESPEKAWERIPKRLRQEIIDKKIKIYTLPGFDIARKATDRADLQLRMQGNSFLGAFFKVSTFLKDNNIQSEDFENIVRAQYNKKFGRFGEAVVESNMQVMTGGFNRVSEVPHGDVNAPDNSSMRIGCITPVARDENDYMYNNIPTPMDQSAKQPIQTTEMFDKEFRAGLGYDQPASALSAVGLMAAGTGVTASKYVARRLIPKYYAENCTQCMECISGCPDTALPNTAQDVATVLRTAAINYVTNASERANLIKALPKIEEAARADMNKALENKESVAFQDILKGHLNVVEGVSESSLQEFVNIIDILPLAYSKVNAIYKTNEKKNPGSGGFFSIFVSDLCKGCGLCVELCGDHEALEMVPESEEINAETIGATQFLNLLPDTPQKYLGFYDDENAADAKVGVLKNHLMVRRNYDAYVSGDGACAGCGEKSVLRSVATITEAYMRPMFHRKAARLESKVAELKEMGVARLQTLKNENQDAYELMTQAIAHLIMGLGGENEADTLIRMGEHGPISDEEYVEALSLVLAQDAYNHKTLQTKEGRLANGMSVMAMGAHTGCNTVFGSTPPNNPHPYPWMNSLFQDGSTITWMFGESFIMDHSRRSVIPERLANILLSQSGQVMTKSEYFKLSHFTDNHMTELEIKELPKAWAIGGDGGMGDIGYQNVSKVVLQNRPNVKLLMLDTQVYSNTGGQNSDSSLMLGGYDMNQFGEASQGKMTEKKGVAESFIGGHGSPFVAQVSMANSANLYRALLDGLEYRGTAFFQCFTTCQPEHGVADDMSVAQAQLIRDSRGVPEFVYNPTKGESFADALDIKGNPTPRVDWYTAKFKSTGEKYKLTTAHWCLTEARFRRHHAKVKEEQTKDLVHLEDILARITQDDVVNRRFLDPSHRSFVPDFGVYIQNESNGKINYHTLSRQMVLFCVERRKAWRLIQSQSGTENKEYLAQKNLLKKVDSGKIALEDFLKNSAQMLAEEVEALKTK